MTYVKSDIDNQMYLVRDLPDKQNAANTLARLKQNIMTITNYLYTNIDNPKYKDFAPYIRQLHKRIQNTVIIESSANSIYTSYSVNKGEQIVFCIRSVKNKDDIHDINLMMYVVLHEMAHVACPETGHTELFKKIFSFLTTTAIELGLYYKIPFGSDPKEYCNMTITDSII
uniref:Uncharacterized protein n=1 Tax=viral metagenome TaxID=1070528 RepID=A0A6C0EBI8_9ZZZZ